MIRRTKRKGDKADKIKHLRVVEVHHELSCEERTCDCCGDQMKLLGTKVVRDEVHYVPAELYVKRHMTHSYECDCHNPELEVKQIKSAKAPRAVFSSGSIVGSTLLAWIIYLKFVLSVPLYRQVNDWQRTGLVVSRRTLSNWVIEGSFDYLLPIYELLKEELQSRDVAHADETVYQILNRSDLKPATSDSRLWAFQTLEEEEKPVVLYHSSLTRSRDEIKEVLGAYQGYLHCDAYVGYKNISGIKDVGCWAHARRKFKEVPQPKGEKQTKASIAVSKCDRMFKIERELKSLSPEQRHLKRQLLLKPLMEEFFDWLGSFEALGNLKKAVAYSLNQKQSLMRVLEDGRLQLSNNVCEQKIKSLVIGRKNHLFSASERGATANAIAYTIVVTAKQNGLDPYKYLEYLFTNLPDLGFRRKPELLKDFLPWAKLPQQLCAASPSTNQLAS